MHSASKTQGCSFLATLGFVAESFGIQELLTKLWVMLSPLEEAGERRPSLSIRIYFPFIPSLKTSYQRLWIFDTKPCAQPSVTAARRGQYWAFRVCVGEKSED